MKEKGAQIAHRTRNGGFPRMTHGTRFRLLQLIAAFLPHCSFFSAAVPGGQRAAVRLAPSRGFTTSTALRSQPNLCHQDYWRGGASTMTAETSIVTRPLQLEDFSKGYLELLAQLTKVGDYDQAKFEAQFQEIAKRQDDYKVMVIEDLEKQKIIATATLLIEHKFIRNCGKCGHIEDVVVDTTYRGLRLGLRVIEALTKLAEEAGCYKIILDCSDDNVPFYEKCGLYKKEVQMVKYL